MKKAWTIVCKLYPASALEHVKDARGKALKFDSEEEAKIERARLSERVSGRSAGGGPYYFVVPA